MSEARSVVDSIHPDLLSAYENKNGVDIRQAMRHHEHYGQSVWVLHPRIMIPSALLYWITLASTMWIFFRDAGLELKLEHLIGVVLWTTLAAILLGVPWWLFTSVIVDKPRQKQAEHMAILEPFFASLGYSRENPNKYWRTEAMARSELLALAQAKVAAQRRLRAICATYSENHLEVYDASKDIINLGVAFDAMLERARKFVEVDVSAVFRDAEARWAVIESKTRK